MSESISKNIELENEVSLDMSYFWNSDHTMQEDMINNQWSAEIVAAYSGDCLPLASSKALCSIKFEDVIMCF